MILALLMFLFPLAYSPGPGNLYFAAAGARFGASGTLAASAGYHLATWGITLMIGFGSLTIIVQAPAVFGTLKLLGGLYILWIAWRFLKASHTGVTKTASSARFSDGVMLLLLNPKAYVIIALMFTQFLPPSDRENAGLVILITTVFTLNNLLAFTVWTLVGDQLATVFSSPEQARLLNKGFALMLFGVAVWILLA